MTTNENSGFRNFPSNQIVIRENYEIKQSWFICPRCTQSKCVTWFADRPPGDIAFTCHRCDLPIVVRGNFDSVLDRVEFHFEPVDQDEKTWQAYERSMSGFFWRRVLFDDWLDNPNWHGHIVVDTKGHRGQPIIGRTRTPVEYVIEALEAGAPLVKIQQHFDITENEIRAAVAFECDVRLKALDGLAKIGKKIGM